jgi:hypothetical protein
LTSQVQYFATGTSGTDFNILSAVDTHTFNLPTASAVNRGALSAADWGMFNAKQNALTLTTTGNSGASSLIGATLNVPTYTLAGLGGIGGTIATGQVAFGTAANTVGGDNGLFWNNTNKRLGVGTNAPTASLDINGIASIQNGLNIFGGALGPNGNNNLRILAGPASVIILEAISTTSRLRFFRSGVHDSTIVGGTGSTNNLSFQISGSEVSRFAPSGNLLLNTVTDAGFRLDVNGSTRFNGLSTIQGTTASDSGQLGAELLTTGTGDASWTGTDFATGYTHVVGSTTTLTSTLAGVVNTFYQITYTVTGRTAGSFTIAFGGFTSSPLTATGAVGPRATTTGTLVITPTSDFDGTIVLSIRIISASSASVTFNSSAGTVTNQIRISSNNSNTIIGNSAGSRNTTGSGLSIYGRNAGQSNTTGFANSFFGEASGGSNTTGSNNSFFGTSAGVNNTTGGSNSFFGQNSGAANTTGGDNSAFGVQSLFNNTTGIQNTAIGLNAMRNSSVGNSNTAVGHSSMLTVSGTSNTAIGHSSLLSVGTGVQNSVIGVNALSNSSGNNNIAFGVNAGRYTGSGTTAMTSVNNSIYLGFQTRGLNATGSTNELVIGYDVVGLGSNTTVLGNTSTTHGRWFGSLLLGTTTNAASSILTMESTTQGFLPPRMTSAQRTAIASPATGLIVYQTDGVEGLYLRTSTAWRALGII